MMLGKKRLDHEGLPLCHVLEKGEIKAFKQRNDVVGLDFLDKL